MSQLSASEPLRCRLERDDSRATLPDICTPNALSGAPQTISVRASFINKVRRECYTDEIIQRDAQSTQMEVL